MGIEGASQSEIVAGKPSVKAAGHLSEHLANERTHLAYIRTALSVMGFGITINRFSIFLLQSNLMPKNGRGFALVETERVGLGLAILGMFILLWSGVRFAQVNNAIDRNEYHSNTRAVWIFTAVIIVIAAASMVWLFQR